MYKSKCRVYGLSFYQWHTKILSWSCLHAHIDSDFESFFCASLWWKLTIFKIQNYYNDIWLRTKEIINSETLCSCHVQDAKFVPIHHLLLLENDMVEFLLKLRLILCLQHSQACGYLSTCLKVIFWLLPSSLNAALTYWIYTDPNYCVASSM